MKQVLRSLKSLACPCNVGRVPRPGVVLRSLKSLACPFIRSEPPRIQRPRPKSRFVRARFAPTACPQAGASAYRSAEAKPALAPASRARTARQGAVSSRDPGTPPSGGSLRRQPMQGAVSSPRRCPNQPLLGSMWRKWLKAAAWTLAFLQPPQRPCAAPHSETFDNSLSLDEVAEPSPKNRLAGTPKHKPGTARLPPNRGFAFDYLAPFAVPPQLPQASAPKRLSADSRPQLFPTSAFFLRFLPSFARHPNTGRAQRLTHGGQFGEKR